MGEFWGRDNKEYKNVVTRSCMIWRVIPSNFVKRYLYSFQEKNGTHSQEANQAMLRKRFLTASPNQEHSGFGTESLILIRRKIQVSGTEIFFEALPGSSHIRNTVMSASVQGHRCSILFVLHHDLRNSWVSLAPNRKVYSVPESKSLPWLQSMAASSRQ